MKLGIIKSQKKVKNYCWIIIKWGIWSCKFWSKLAKNLPADGKLISLSDYYFYTMDTILDVISGWMTIFKNQITRESLPIQVPQSIGHLYVG